MHGGKVGNLRVPFQQRGTGASAGDGVSVQPPDRVDHPAVVGVDQVGAAVGVSREMILHDAVGRDAVEILDRIKLMIHRCDVDVIHIEQQATVGLGHHPRDKLPLGHLRLAKREIAAGVFEHQRLFQKVLHLPHA